MGPITEIEDWWRSEKTQFLVPTCAEVVGLSVNTEHFCSNELTMKHLLPLNFICGVDVSCHPAEGLSIMAELDFPHSRALSQSGRRRWQIEVMRVPLRGGMGLAWVGGPDSNFPPGFNELQSSARAAFHHLLFGQTGGSINP
jgi:hypothetical protein